MDREMLRRGGEGWREKERSGGTGGAQQLASFFLSLSLAAVSVSPI